MAFLIRFAPAGVPQWQGNGLYLDQAFYEQLHTLCVRHPGVFPTLQVAAQLGYDDEVSFNLDQLSNLQAELSTALPLHQHPQFAAFCALLTEALNQGTSLAIAGDMHPVLHSLP